MRIRRSITLLAGAGILSAAAAATSLVLASSPAYAIPGSQEACGSPGLTLTGGTGPYHSMGLSVTVNDGTTGRNVVVFTSLDGNVSPNAEMRLSWSVDGGPVSDYAFGPGNIAENQQFDGTRTVMDVIHLGAGTHTLTPEVRLSGSSTTSGIVDRLCVVAEAFTK